MKTSKKYFPSEIEPRWQKKWKEDKLYNPEIKTPGNPFYNLMMFPYPSAEGLHVGNMYAFTGSDIYGRYQRMKGFDVFEPIGLDGFGIHSENYALKVNQNPMDLAKVTEKHFYEQLTMIGNGYDWNHTVETFKPNYYRWTQWLFLQMFKNGLAYRKKANVNWCPSCKTVLSDEQVISGECERCSSKVEKKELEQWFFRITKYADRLLENLDKIDWSLKIKLAQRNWIGKKEGINITYQIKDCKETVTCFTTRPDTNFGATFVVLGPENSLIEKITLPEYLEEVKKYIASTTNISEVDRIVAGREKTGVFTGRYAINQLTGSEMLIWVSDFVIGSVGTGAVVGVPGHDIRDFEFAKTFNLPVIRVVIGKDGDKSSITRLEQVQEDEGIMINSDFLNGLDIHQATEKIMNYLVDKGWGERTVSYHLRDWLISRQRYWGPPIPIIYCDKCGIVPVPEEDLPVTLPKIDDFRPTGTGNAPLASLPEFVDVKCPKCQSKARRETDVSDTFLDSSWYFLRYPSTDFNNQPFDKKQNKTWLPVDMYIGGAEHSVLHLLYSRFVTMVLHDLGFLDFEEPYTKFRAHGLIISEGAKMSKSKGNVVNPDGLIKEYGADSLRTYLMFMGPLADGGDFQKLALGGVYRFLSRVWDMVQTIPQAEATPEEKYFFHKTIKRVTEGIEELHYNVSIAALMEFINFIFKQKSASTETIKSFLLMLAPFAPFITEELWFHLAPEGASRDNKNWSIHFQPWPKYQEKYLQQDQVNIALMVDGKVRDQLMISSDILNNDSEVEKQALMREKIQKYLQNKSILKVVYVPGNIFNIVTR